MTATLTDAENIIAQLVKLVKAQDGILAAYRLQSRTPAKHIDNAMDARRRLKEMGVL